MVGLSLYHQTRIYIFFPPRLLDSEKLDDGAEFEVIGDPDELKKAQEEKAKEDGVGETSAAANNVPGNVIWCYITLDMRKPSCGCQ